MHCLYPVKEERRSRTENNPAALLREQLSAASYMVHTYGRPVIGWMSEVGKLTAADAEAFYRKYYTPSNAALVVAGDVDANVVHELAIKYYKVCCFWFKLNFSLSQSMMCSV